MRHRLLVPALLVAFVAAVGLSFFVSAPARAQVRSSAPGPARSASAAAANTTLTTTYRGEPTTLPGPPTPPKPPAVTTTTGVSPPTTLSLAQASVARGHILFQENCASCHGPRALGSTRAPNLQGLGAATVDFWVSTGRMPLAFPTAQANTKPPRFTRPEVLDIVKYVTSLAPGGPGIPYVDLKKANQGSGFSLFATNCAGCHAITGVGDALTNGLHAPSLDRHDLSATQVAEAMRTGPGNMPRFAPGQLNQQQITDLVGYVVNGGIQKPYDKGGHGLGHVGPITEGFVGIFGGLGAMLALLWWIGERRAKA